MDVEVDILVEAFQDSKKVTKLEQFVHSIGPISSKYNNSFSVSYSPENLVAQYERYPSYGDFPQTYLLKTYGKWWNESESAQQEYRPQDKDPYGAEDYVTLKYESSVLPRDVCIYETYNPGAVVRIWGRNAGRPWKLLWEGPPQVCPQQSRKFQPKIRTITSFINQIRLEFNQSHLKYHTSIDAVLLGGFQPRSKLQADILLNDLWKFVGTVGTICTRRNDSYDPNVPNYFSQLPYEVIIHIFQNLDLMSLCKCSQVNTAWNLVTQDPILYENLGLRIYWQKVCVETITYYSERCTSLKKLDLSWCGNEVKGFAEAFIKFVGDCCTETLTHLSLCHCDFVNNDVIRAISKCTELTDLRLRSTRADPDSYKCLMELEKLVNIDVSSTSISDDSMGLILKSNPNLEHINNDLCENLKNLDAALEKATLYNKKLRTWKMWKTMSLTPNGAKNFGKLHELRELDLGWVFIISDPRDCLEHIARGCPNLKRLVLSQWRGLSDQMLQPVILNNKNLEYLDLQGIRTITSDICEQAFMALPNLQLLEISFCKSIANEQVNRWRQQHRNVTIQRSCQNTVQIHEA